AGWRHLVHTGVARRTQPCLEPAGTRQRRKREISAYPLCSQYAPGSPGLARCGVTARSGVARRPGLPIGLARLGVGLLTQPLPQRLVYLAGARTKRKQFWL